MKTCALASNECVGEVHTYEYYNGEPDPTKPERRRIKFFADYCEFHKRGELAVRTKVRPSLPYQGIARRAVQDK